MLSYVSGRVWVWDTLSLRAAAQVRLMEQLEASGLQAPDISAALRLRPQVRRGRAEFELV
jgi:hypothetical protein